MKLFLKILYLLAISLAGFSVLPLVTASAMALHALPQPADEPLLYLMKIGPCVWLAAVLASIGSLFLRGELRLWLLFAPLYIPALYGVLTVVYFHFAK